MLERAFPGALDRAYEAEKSRGVSRVKYVRFNDVTWVMAVEIHEDLTPKQRLKKKLRFRTQRGAVIFKCDPLCPFFYRVGEDRCMWIALPQDPRIEVRGEVAETIEAIIAAETGNHESRGWTIRVPTAPGQPVRG